VGAAARVDIGEVAFIKAAEGIQQPRRASEAMRVACQQDRGIAPVDTDLGDIARQTFLLNLIEEQREKGQARHILRRVWACIGRGIPSDVDLAAALTVLGVVDGIALRQATRRLGRRGGVGLHFGSRILHRS
jgi:hypothetical protein